MTFSLGAVTVQNQDLAFGCVCVCKAEPKERPLACYKAAMTSSTPPIQLAATVVPMRPSTDPAAAPEILLLQRAAGLAFFGGAWVFPGGRIDPEDGDPSDFIACGKRAALRELSEEAGIRVEPLSLTLISRWLTPPGQSRRFDTLHFIAQALPDQSVTIQAAEVAGYRWLSAAEALKLHAHGELELPPPTYVTLIALAPMHTIAQARAELGKLPMHYVPRPQPAEDGLIYLYAEDAGYESGDLAAPGARHRLYVPKRKSGQSWRYER
jgi:8-oxo-dGTP pyrophosphatase MutT (NUDIX family)